jgi:beta-lactamase superfamily II metal-dependent hydrolase
MIFSLEALNARHGDCLLLHYGTAKAPKLIVIDGGPKGVYEAALRPRLEELRAVRAPDGTLPIRLLMVSHIDDDHICGVLALAREVEEAEADGETAPFRIATLWHNSFDDLVKRVKATNLAELALAATGPARLDRAGSAVPASVAQGRELRGLAKKLGMGLNTGFKELVVSPAKGKKTLELPGKLSFTIIGPRQAQLDKLQNDWEKRIKALKAKGQLEPAAMSLVAAAFVDESVNNLSSLVVLAEVGKKRMLLTGDARGDFLLEGLAAAGLLKKTPFQVDIFKLPHHGSIRNTDQELFEKIRAKHYVISADGKHGNPDLETLEQLIASRSDDDEYTIHLTNRVAKVAKFLERARASRNFEVVYREPDELSLKIDLGEEFSE